LLQIVAQREGYVYTSPPIHIPNVATLFKSLHMILANLPEEERYNLFFTLAHHSGLKDARYPQRTTGSFDYQTILGFDVDKGPELAKFQEYRAVLATLLKCEPGNLIAVNSGNGLHFYVNLKHPIREASFFKEMRPYYLALLEKLNAELKKLGLPGEFDSKVFDPARVMRVPGTWNKKPGKPDVRSELLEHSDAWVDVDLKVVSGLGDLERQNISPADVRRQYPRPDFPEVVKECRFFRWAEANPHEIHEPHAFDLFSLLKVQPEDSKATWRGVEQSPEEIALDIFTLASSSKSLARADFEYKWEGAAKYGARKCETVNQTWGGCASQCPYYGRINTPLALKRPEHIASEANGFWVINKNGAPQYPNYSDLSKVFMAEKPMLACPSSEKMMVYTGTHYSLLTSHEVKSWLERKVLPVDPLRDSHASEFVAKLKRAGGISAQEEQEFFTQKVRGKLNCANGVLDILSGELTSHSKEHGFLNVLPYDYVAGQSSDFFMDWLSTMTVDRTELMDSLLDIMAYVLWPSYDDHAMIYLVGEGRNGKSTLIHLIQHLVGPQNYSSASLDQLVNNRFAPANLEGKLVNLSEESSGSEVTSDQLNVLKNLSGGGILQVERKGEQGYVMQNTAKLIFSANKTPRFKETGEAVKRRLLVIPFDHKIENMDPKVADRLFAEAPQILSMLVRRIQNNVAKNEGSFSISRGGRAGEQAAERFLNAHSTTIQWAKEHLESSPDFDEEEWVEVGEAYANYNAWVEDNKIRYPDNKLTFAKMLRENFVSHASLKSPITRNNAKQVVRVFRRTKWKTQLEVNV
jgi:P4 family phage/plasmid primase-like protien